MNRNVVLFVVCFCAVIFSSSKAAVACGSFGGTLSTQVYVDIDGTCIEPYSTTVTGANFCVTVTGGPTTGYYSFSSNDLAVTPSTADVDDTGRAYTCLDYYSGSTQATIDFRWYEGGVSSNYMLLSSFMVKTAGANTAPKISGVSDSPSTLTNAGDIKFTVSASDPDGDQLTYSWTQLSGPAGDLTSKLGLCSGASCTVLPLPPGDYSLKVGVDDGNGGTAEVTHAFTVTERIKASCYNMLNNGVTLDCTFEDLDSSSSSKVTLANAKVYVGLAANGFTVGDAVTLQSSPFDVLFNYYYRDNQAAKEYVAGTTLMESATDSHGKMVLDLFLNFGKMASQLSPEYWPTPAYPVVIPVVVETDTPFALKKTVNLSIDRIGSLRSARVVERPGCPPGTIGCTLATSLQPDPNLRTQLYSDYRAATGDTTARVSLEDTSRNWLGAQEVTFEKGGSEDRRLTGGTTVNLDTRNFQPDLCPSCSDALRPDNSLEPYWLIVSADFLDGVIGSVGLSSDDPGTYSIAIGRQGSDSFTGWTYWSSFKGWVKGQMFDKAVEKAIPVVGPAQAVKDVVEIVGAASTYQRTKFMRLNSAVWILTDHDGETTVTTREGQIDVILEGDTTSLDSIGAGETGAIPYDQDTVTVQNSSAEQIAAADNSLANLEAMVNGYTLTLTKLGSGSGTLTSSPDGINCGADCTANFSEGDSVTLTATAASDSTFAGWSSECASGTVTMDAAKNCVATFNATSSGSDNGGGGCFIATAAYGSYLDPHVMVLRSFRDHHLLTNSLGRAFTDFYYANSPPLADFIAEREPLRLAVRLSLTPLVFGLEYPALASLFLIAMLTVVLTVVRRSRE
jgi:hypothetical protein